MLRRVVEACLTPPLLPLLMLGAGFLLRRRWRKTGTLLVAGSILLLWALATPFVAGHLLRSRQTAAPLPATGPLPPADAIVILSAEADREAPEYGDAVVGPMTMQRVRYGAFLHRRTGLPILCSGGKPSAAAPPLGELMRRALVDEFRIPEVRWTEDRSADTFENAQFSVALLQPAGVRSILLVTSAWHLPRASRCFEQLGITVIPAGTGYRGEPYDNWMSLLPQWPALRDSCLALHEIYGAIWYRLR
ncbi:MAG: YdcF family protein [Planctomycetes bacterium]|nr:YdcF family protein [Planctomycetota bacterium]